MEFLNKIFTRDRASVQQLPSGTVTVDRHGQIVTSTVSSSYPNKLLIDIGADVLTLFREARAAQIPMAEVSVQFGCLHITARELRGGAIIFLLPRTASFSTSATSRP
jgi:hypothetical protein